MKASARVLGMAAILWAPALAGAADKLNATVSWLGNTYPGAVRWVPQDIHTIFVTPDGSVFTNVGWDEGGGQVGIYRDGNQVARATHTHGWGAEGGEAIAVNSQYVYIGMNMQNEAGGLKDLSTWPTKGKTWFGISRRYRSDISQAAPFAGGKGGKGDTLKECFLIVDEVDVNQKADVTGLAADSQRLFAASRHQGRILGYSAETMRPTSSWPVDRPGPIVLDTQGNLWVIETGDARHAPRVIRLDRDGRRLPQVIEFPPGVVPTAIAAPGPGRLLIADDGPDQQIRIYEDCDKSPWISGTFGKKGESMQASPVSSPRLSLTAR